MIINKFTYDENLFTLFTKALNKCSVSYSLMWIMALSKKYMCKYMHVGKNE